MKVAILANGSSIHTVRWANGLSELGMEVHLVSQHKKSELLNAKVKFHKFRFLGNLGYFAMVSGVRRLLRQVKPDILNAHYASGYGTTARLVNYHPWILSVWGSDVYDFPLKSKLHRVLVIANLCAADAVASTSYCMEKQVRKLAPNLRYLAVTPFGVDCRIFSPAIDHGIKMGEDKTIIIGTVKTLTSKYGIDLLIHAFAMVLKALKGDVENLSNKIRLRIIGHGPDRDLLLNLAKSLSISESIDFVGGIPHSSVPLELSKFDIYVALSRLDSESFGVAVIEAGAMGLPVLVSDVEGLAEVVLDGTTGIVVPRENPGAAAEVLTRLIQDEKLRIDLGKRGREHVLNKYDWSRCLESMVELFKNTINCSSSVNQKRTNTQRYYS